MKRFALSTLFLVLAFPVGAQEEKGKTAESKPSAPTAEEKAPVVTGHQIRLKGGVLDYKVETGMMAIRKDTGEVEGEIFYMAYTLDGGAGGAPKEGRPLTFSFNGGPGSSSVWLHLGMLGPKRVPMLADGGMPAPPYRLVDNEYSWLDLTDIVFIDPVGTGFSRPASPDRGKDFWGLEGDIRSVGEFIRLYLTRHERWSSPLYLIGESYGTTRAAGLSGYLVDRSGVAFNGIILVSTVLNFQTNRFTEGNDLPYLTYLPTYTATAWYHQKLEPELQADLQKTLEEVKKWAAERYWVALAKGANLSPAERQETVSALSRYTGLSKEFIDQADLRVEAGRFRKELLRDRKLTVGRLDSRFVGMDRDAAGEEYEFDPSMAAIRPPYTAAFNDYVRGELGYESDLHYWILGGGIGRWDFGDQGRFPDTSKALRDAMLRNTYMKVFVASGYYDMATPFFGTEYTLSHLGVPESLRGNLRVEEYEAGHMMYIHEGSLAKMKNDITSFYQETKSMSGRGVANVPGGQ
jgi:carboxypeptidase C (cathepsin A)